MGIKEIFFEVVDGFGRLYGQAQSRWVSREAARNGNRNSKVRGENLSVSVKAQRLLHNLRSC
jgi:hypothetical protein